MEADNSMTPAMLEKHNTKKQLAELLIATMKRLDEAARKAVSDSESRLTAEREVERLRSEIEAMNASDSRRSDIMNVLLDALAMHEVQTPAEPVLGGYGESKTELNPPSEFLQNWVARMRGCVNPARGSSLRRFFGEPWSEAAVGEINGAAKVLGEAGRQ